MTSASGPGQHPEPIPRALIVLGMHRSGTSALTRVLSLLGAALPNQLMRPLEHDNPSGFWESKQVAAISDQLLELCGSNWHSPLALPPLDLSSRTVRSLSDTALDLLSRDFTDQSLFVLKDPRFCRTLPFWQMVLDRFGVRPACVLILRHPLEVERSLNARQGLAPVHAHFLWLRYNLEAERHSRGRRRCFVSYDQLMSDWRQVVSTIEHALKLTWPRTPEHAGEAIGRFLQPELRHHRLTADDLESRDDVHPWVKSAFRSLQLATAGDTEDLASDLDAISAAIDPLDRLHDALDEYAISSADQDSSPASIDTLKRRLAVRDFELQRRDRELQSMETRLLNSTRTLDEHQAEGRRTLREILRAASPEMHGEARS